jgi:hypothetical protein
LLCRSQQQYQNRPQRKRFKLCRCRSQATAPERTPKKTPHLPTNGSSERTPKNRPPHCAPERTPKKTPPLQNNCRPSPSNTHTNPARFAFINPARLQNVNVRNIGQGEPRHRKYKRLKLGGGQAYDRSND